ncbi:MAG: TatD family hydrolase [Acidobacteriota bacterium]
MSLIDSHCHLQHFEGDERERVLDAARAAGVTGFLVPAVRLDQGDDLLAFCHAHDDVWCALGVHPHDAATWQDGDEARLAELLRDPKVVAVGECGLDFFYDHAPREIQEHCLRAQWRVAIAANLPVVVHNRESDEAMLAMVREPEFAALGGDFHSFAGHAEMHRELLARGFYFGFSGMVTFNKADNIRALLAATPLDRILVETDSPFLAPVPYRGKPNQPAWVAAVARRVATERGMQYDDLCTGTADNFVRLFARAQ